MSRRRPTRTWYVLTLALLAGCAVGPDYHRPAAPGEGGSPVETYGAAKVGAGSDAQELVPAQAIPAEWWEVFQSPQLTALVERSLRSNPDIAAAEAALREAHEMTVAQRGFYFPTVTANFEPTRQQLAGNLGGNSPGLQGNGTTIQTYQNPNGPPFNGPVTYNFYTAEVGISYSLDVFGQNRRAVESFQAQEDAQRYALEAAELTLSSNVVYGAIQEASLRAQLAASERIIEINRSLLAVIKAQLATGYTNAPAVAVQEQQLALAIAAVPPLRKQLEQGRDLLARLAGQPPGPGLAEEFSLANLHLPKSLPLSLPSELVQHRPDVRQAEENLHTASAQVGVAESARLPQFSIQAAYGGTASRISQIFADGGPFWSLLGDVTQPIFAGGTLRAHQEAAEEALRQARAQYIGTVLNAFQNVADALHALDEDALALTATRDAEAAAKKAFDQTLDQGRRGYANTTTVLATEQAYQQAEVTLVAAEANQDSDSVALFQALGGGWGAAAAAAGGANQ